MRTSLQVQLPLSLVSVSAVPAADQVVVAYMDSWDQGQCRGEHMHGRNLSSGLKTLGSIEGEPWGSGHLNRYPCMALGWGCSVRSTLLQLQPWQGPTGTLSPLVDDDDDDDDEEEEEDQGGGGSRRRRNSKRRIGRRTMVTCSRTITNHLLISTVVAADYHQIWY